MVIILTILYIFQEYRPKAMHLYVLSAQHGATHSNKMPLLSEIIEWMSDINSRRRKKKKTSI